MSASLSPSADERNAIAWSPEEHRRRLVSLLEMYQFAADQYAKCCFKLEELNGHAILIQAGDSAEAVAETKESVDAIREGLSELEGHCKRMGLDCSGMIRRVSAKISVSPNADSAVALIDEVKHAVLKGFKDRKCYLMTTEESEMVEWSQPGPVATSFPESARELARAARCLAFGLHEATVFHSMLALESPMRAVARYFSVPFDGLTSWGTAIGSIKNKIDAISRTAKRSKRKSDTLQFYGEAAKEFSYFAEAWRNHVMHSRGEYDVHTARSVWEHVEQFSAHLSRRLSSRSRAKYRA